MRGLTEVVPIQDTVCSGIGAIEHLDGNMLRFWLYVQQAGDDGEMEKIVVAKMVMARALVPDAVMKTIAAIGGTLPNVIPLVPGDKELAH